MTRANNKSLLWEHATFIFFGMMTHILRAENFHFFHGFGVLWVAFFFLKVGGLRSAALEAAVWNPHAVHQENFSPPFFFSDSDCSTSFDMIGLIRFCSRQRMHNRGRRCGRMGNSNFLGMQWLAIEKVRRSVIFLSSTMWV